MRRDLPVGLALTRILSDGSVTPSSLGDDDESDVTCGMTPDTGEVRDMQRRLEEGRIPDWSVLTERGLMSTSLGRRAHGELSHCRGIELRLVVGPRVQGIPIEEEGTINDVILPPGQKMAIRKVEGVANGRLVVDAVLLSHDFDGALTEAERQGLELAQAIVGDETRKALQVADSNPGLLANPNLLHGHSAQTLALRRAMETTTHDSADLVRALRHETGRRGCDGADWYGLDFEASVQDVRGKIETCERHRRRWSEGRAANPYARLLDIGTELFLPDRFRR